MGATPSARPTRRLWRAGIALVSIALLAAACARHRAAQIVDLPTRDCRTALTEQGVAFRPVSPVGSGSCRIDGPVSVSRTSAEMRPTLTTSCAMALAWSEFETAELQPLAVRRFGSEVATVEHYGSYGCRRMTGNANRMSLHSKAQALDIAGFVLEDGRTISVQDNWWDGWWLWRSDEARFLRDVSEAACDFFSVTLTPESDSYHQDHIHVDLGPWRHCGM